MHCLFLGSVSIEFVFNAIVITDFITATKVIYLLLSIEFHCMPIPGLPIGHKQY